MIFTKIFKELSRYDVAIAGGKGASLGEMTQAGLNVPPGFVVLAPAFDRFLEETDLNVEIETRLKTVNKKDLNTVDRASNEIRAILAKTKMPKDLETEILANFKKLKARFVAVRSSATSEDSKTASWAGELETYLNVTEKDLIKQVMRCWSSLFTPRAIFYRFEKKLNKTKISVAVVVQKMVQSEISGIAFTVHPVTKDPNQMVIEAGFGLGEAIVSGMVTPDTYIVHKDDFSILDINVSSQAFAIIKTLKGNVNKKLSATQGGKQKLSGKQIIELAQLCKRIETHYAHPQDIEWAIEKGQYYLIQSRPITTL